MKKHHVIGLVIGFLMVCTVGRAGATVIVDTGVENPPGNHYWTLSPWQWSAGEFSISEDYNVTGLEGYLVGYNWSGPQSKTLTAAIYSDGGDIPGSKLYSQQFSVGEPNGWYGVSGQNWLLSAGTYWAAFIVDNLGADYYVGGISGMATNPLLHEATYSLQTHSFTPYVENMSVRIYGDPVNPVPEPATMLLFGFGLIGLAGSRIRRKKKQL